MIKDQKNLNKKVQTPIFAVPKKGPDSDSYRNYWDGSTKNEKGSLAQLVQSICLTSRGSAVRSRQLPLKIGKGFSEC